MLGPSWSLRIVVLCAPLALACGQAAAPPRGPGIAVDVAALTLPGVGDVCYNLTTTNDAGELVWSASRLCASQYGNGAGGDLAYVATCDATDTVPDDGVDALNTVTLELAGVYPSAWSDASPPDDLADYLNPCPPGDGCTLTSPCVENADQPIAFNLTLMRQANQGFFDVAVSFEDIFCSAKLDCVDADGDDLLLLSRPDGGGRGPSVVLGFTCTGGSDADTWLYLNDLVVSCSNPGFGATIDPSAGPGNVTPDPNDGGILFGAQISRGDQQLGNVSYWNVVLGLDQAALADAGSCRLTALGTASDGLLDGATPDATSYPLVTWDVPLTEDGVRVCTRHALNDGSGVATTYTAPGTPASLVRGMNHGSSGEVVALGAGPAAAALAAGASLFQWQGVQADFAGSCTGRVTAAMDDNALCYVDATNHLVCAGVIADEQLAGWVDQGLTGAVQVLMSPSGGNMVALTESRHVVYKGVDSNFALASSGWSDLGFPPTWRIATGTFDQLCGLLLPASPGAASEARCTGLDYGGAGSVTEPDPGALHRTLWMDGGGGTRFDDPAVFRAAAGRAEVARVVAGGLQLGSSQTLAATAFAGHVVEGGNPGFQTSPLFLTDDGRVFESFCPQPGPGGRCRVTPTQTQRFTAGTSIAIVANPYSRSVCAVFNDGSLWCRGDNHGDKFALGSESSLSSDTMVLAPGSVMVPRCH